MSKVIKMSQAETSALPHDIRLALYAIRAEIESGRKPADMLVWVTKETNPEMRKWMLAELAKHGIEPPSNPQNETI